MGATRQNLECASIRVCFPLAHYLGVSVFVLRDESIEIAPKALPLGEGSVEKPAERRRVGCLLDGYDEVRKAKAGRFVIGPAELGIVRELRL